jgi:CHAT domain-containing protein
LKYLGDQLTKQGELNKAIDTYQLAIMQFDHEFVDKDVSRNPGNFVTVFSYIQLFNTLVAKADAMTRLYDQKGGQRMLESALDAYKSAFDLADYVEKTYDSDEARLFLNKIKYTVHNKPIDVSLRLYALTRKRSFLEDAYQYDQQSKASILSLNVRENEIRNTLKVDNPLVIREASLKNAITRLSLKASQLTDSPALQAINASIRDYKIQLGKIQDAANADPVYRQKRLATGIPTVRDVQQLLDESTSLLSYHLADTALVILVINPGSFDYARLPIDRLFFTMVDSLKHALGTAPGQHRYGGSAPAMFLYNKLIHPIAASLSGKTRLIVIPDDELNYLPFEALQDSARHYLVENFSVQYQYSTALLDRQGSTSSAQGLVAFAPFARRGFTGSGDLSLPVLPASQEETRGLKGETLIDSQATRERFLQQANKYGIIHLATHASVDNESPLRSYIAFYPSNEKEEYRLYAGEIYNLSLDSTRLVVLSACETGTGQLVKGEGLMSLTRAFTYAGCPNIITSLWKAEDKTTAFITRRLHEYLEKGHTKDWALRQAKLDLLNDTEMDPRFKTPDCWAHLIFIGEYERGKDGYRWWMVAVLAVLIALVLSWLIKRKPSRRDRDGTGFHR